MRQFVIDASVAIKLFVEEPLSPAADTTGVPCARPHSAAAHVFRPPTREPGSTTRGSRDMSMPHARQRVSDQLPRARSPMPVHVRYVRSMNACAAGRSVIFPATYPDRFRNLCTFP